MQQRLKAKHMQEVRALELNRLIQGTCFVQIISHLAHVEGTVTHCARLVILRVCRGKGLLVGIALAHSRVKFLVAGGSDQAAIARQNLLEMWWQRTVENTSQLDQTLFYLGDIQLQLCEGL